jgi:hypothetical protein
MRPDSPQVHVIVGDESAITTPLCTRCHAKPAHPEAFTLCEDCDDEHNAFVGITDVVGDVTHRMLGA